MSSIVKKHHTIPDDWKIIKIKDVLNEVKYGSSKKLNTEGEGILSLGIPNIIQGEISLKFKRYSEIDDTELARYILNDVEILIVRTNANPDNIGRCALFENIKVQTIFTSYLIKIKINNEKILPKFLTYYLQSNISRRQFLMRARTSAGKYNLSIPEIKSIELILPPLLEQQRVISILLNVDKSILKAQQLIENLQLLKKGLMQRLFTEGFGHTVFKETRLGKIPNNWNIIRGKYVYKTMSGITTSRINFEIGDILYLKVSDMNNPVNRINIIDSVIKCSVDNSQHKNIIPIDSIIFPKSGAAIFTNKVGILNQQATLDPNLMALIPKKDKIYYKFLYYYIKYYQLSKICENAGVPQLNNKDLYPLPIIMPPLKEQIRISSILGSIDDKIGNELYYQKKLKKIKKGLMQDLLTGTKRVKINED